MVSRQERKDPREEQKTKGERKDVYQYYYYYPDFPLTLKVVQYRCAQAKASPLAAPSQLFLLATFSSPRCCHSI